MGPELQVFFSGHINFDIISALISKLLLVIFISLKICRLYKRKIGLTQVMLDLSKRR